MEISAVTSLSGTPSLSQVTRAAGKELISALNSQTSSSSADSKSPNSGWMDMNSLAVGDGRKIRTIAFNWNATRHDAGRSRTVDADGDLLGLTLVGDDVGDGARVNARVLDGRLRDRQGVEDLLVLFVLLDRLDGTVTLRSGGKGETVVVVVVGWRRRRPSPLFRGISSGPPGSPTPEPGS